MSVVNKIQYLLSLSLGLFPLIPSPYLSYLISLWALISLINCRKIQFNPSSVAEFIILVSPFFLYVVHAVISENKNNIQAMLTASGFLIFPLGMLFTNHSVWIQNKLLFIRIFSGSIITTGVFSTIYFYVFGFQGNYDISHDFFFIYRNEINQLIKIHPTYISLMIAFVLMFYFLNWNELSNTRKKITLLMCFILLIYFYLLSARTVWVALFVGIIIVMVFSVSKHRWKWILGIAITGMLFVLMNPRNQEFFSYRADTEINNTIHVRSRILECSLEQLKNNFWIGSGPERSEKLLIHCYGNNPVFSKQIYNSHNQYIDFILKFGITGILILLIYLGYSFAKAIQKKNMWHVSLLIMTMICLMTENIFSRQHGLIFFSLMNTWLLISYQQKKATEIQ